MGVVVAVVDNDDVAVVVAVAVVVVGMCIVGSTRMHL